MTFVWLDRIQPNFAQTMVLKRLACMINFNILVIFWNFFNFILGLCKFRNDHIFQLAKNVVSKFTRDPSLAMYSLQNKFQIFRYRSLRTTNAETKVTLDPITHVQRMDMCS